MFWGTHVVLKHCSLSSWRLEMLPNETMQDGNIEDWLRWQGERHHTDLHGQRNIARASVY